MTVQKISQDLQSAGFTDVKVVAELFVVQARSKDGHPVLMTIGPRPSIVPEDHTVYIVHDDFGENGRAHREIDADLYPS